LEKNLWKRAGQKKGLTGKSYKKSRDRAKIAAVKKGCECNQEIAKRKTSKKTLKTNPGGTQSEGRAGAGKKVGDQMTSDPDYDSSLGEQPETGGRAPEEGNPERRAL